MINAMKENYLEMTVNERLYASGLIAEFDKAKKKKDKEALVTILKKIQVDDPSIKKILTDAGITPD
jgi:hypothetical protein